MSHKRKYRKSIINNCLLSVIAFMQEPQEVSYTMPVLHSRMSFVNAHPTYSQWPSHGLHELPRQHPQYSLYSLSEPFLLNFRLATFCFIYWKDSNKIIIIFLITLYIAESCYHAYFPLAYKRKAYPVLMFSRCPGNLVFLDCSCFIYSRGLLKLDTILQLSLPKTYKKKSTSGYSFDFLDLTAP